MVTGDISGRTCQVLMSIWRQKLLPQRGRTRILSLYFLRILVLFFGFYFPTVAMAAVYSGTSEMMWHYVAAITLSYLFVFQAFTTIYMATQKPDIRKAVQSILYRVLQSWRCQQMGEQPGSTEQTMSSNNSAVANDEAPEEEIETEEQPNEDNQGQRVVDDEWEAEDVYDDDDDERIRRRFTLPICMPSSHQTSLGQQNEKDDESYTEEEKSSSGRRRYSIS